MNEVKTYKKYSDELKTAFVYTQLKTLLFIKWNIKKNTAPLQLFLILWKLNFWIVWKIFSYIILLAIPIKITKRISTSHELGT